MRERDLSATGTVLRPRGGSRTGSSERASHPRCGTEPGDGSARRAARDDRRTRRPRRPAPPGSPTRRPQGTRQASGRRPACRASPAPARSARARDDARRWSRRRPRSHPPARPHRAQAAGARTRRGAGAPAAGAVGPYCARARPSPAPGSSPCAGSARTHTRPSQAPPIVATPGCQTRTMPATESQTGIG